MTMSPVSINPNWYGGVPLQTQQPALPYVAQPMAPRPGMVDTRVSANSGPIVQNGAAGLFSTAAKVIPAGSEAALGAARAMLRDPNYGQMAEPLLRLTWDLARGTASFAVNLVTFQWPQAIDDLKLIVSTPFVNTGTLAKKLATPLTASADVSMAPRLRGFEAAGTGVGTALGALKSSFVWSVPASLLNAWMDYKYRDQADMKRLGTNLAADMIGYTATGMVSAGVGAMVGSMTVPLIGTVVGIGVGLLLGFVHDRVVRPTVSDALYTSV